MAAPNDDHTTGSMSEEEWLQFLLIRQEDADNLQTIGKKILPHLPEIIERFYQHLKSYPITDSHLSNPEMVQRLHEIQFVYFQRLFSSDFDPDYFVQRKMIGKTHGRIELNPKWFIGSYNHFIELLFPLIAKYVPDDPKRQSQTLASFAKVLLLDILLAIDAYIDRYASQLLEAQKKLEQKLWIEDRVLFSIMKKSGDAIIGLDEQDRIVTWSQSAQRIFDYKTVEIIDKKPSDLLQDSQLFDRLKTLAQEHGTYTLHAVTWKKKDGETITADSTLTYLSDQNGHHVGTTLIIQDVTEIHRLATEVKNMEKLTAMTNITAGVAHEIRTPLGILSLTADLVQERIAQAKQSGDDPQTVYEDINEHIQDMQLEVGRLNEIVNHYLVLSKIKSPSKLPIELHSYLDSYRKRWLKSIPGKSIDIVFDILEPELEVEIDPDQFSHVFQNLFDNAIHAIPNNGTIRIQAQRKDGEIEIAFRDDGIGIGKERIETLFSPFVTSKPSGTGLGLYLVKEIVEAHHGRVSIESEEGHGTNVFIRLPSDLKDRQDYGTLE